MPRQAAKDDKDTGAGPGVGAALLYLRESRSLGLSMVAVLPLVILYQVGIVQARSPTRNLAEVWITQPLYSLGVPAATVVNVLVIIGCLYGLWKLERTGPVYLGFMGIMVLESVLYALFIYRFMALAAHIVQTEIQTILLAVGGMTTNSLLLSIGAGVYEELFFRLLLVGGGMLALRKLFHWHKFWSAAVALVMSSLLFAAAHHLSPQGEQFDSYAFTFLSLCGFFLGIIFITRGLGVGIWSHAAYNVLVLWHTFHG